MAKQMSVNPIKGTIGNLTYYNANGEALVKRKSESSKERVDNPNYELYNYVIDEFGRGSRLMKPLYWMLPEEKRKHGVFGAMTGMANEMLFNGMKEDEVVMAVKTYLEKEKKIKLNEGGHKVARAKRSKKKGGLYTAVIKCKM